MSGVPTDLDTVCAGEHVLAADQRAPAHELHRAATERAHGRHPGLSRSRSRSRASPVHCLFGFSVEWSQIFSEGVW